MVVLELSKRHIWWFEATELRVSVENQPKLAPKVIYIS